jgi:hypothetical protein
VLRPRESPFGQPPKLVVIPLQENPYPDAGAGVRDALDELIQARALEAHIRPQDSSDISLQAWPVMAPGPSMDTTPRIGCYQALPAGGFYSAR